MNKKELIAKLSILEVPYTETDWAQGYNDGIHDVKKYVAKLDEPEKPLVEQLVADWFEKNKHDLEYKIYKECVETYESTQPDDFKLWFVDPVNEAIETLIKMKLYGYKLENEKRYYVKVFEGVYMYVNKNVNTGELFTGSSTQNGIFQTKFTEKEIKTINPGYWNEIFLEDVKE